MGSESYTIMNILNRKGIRHEPKRETCGELFARINEGYGMSLRGFRDMFEKQTGNKLQMKRDATQEEVAAMERKYPAKNKPKAGAAVTAAKVQPTAALKPTEWDLLVVRSILAIGVVGHAFLICFELGHLYHEAGWIAGALFSCLIVAGVILMWKRAKDTIAENIMHAVWATDFLAIFVHYKALYHSGVNAYGAGINEYGTGCLAVVIGACAGCLVYFYRATGLKPEKK